MSFDQTQTGYVSPGFGGQYIHQQQQQMMNVVAQPQIQYAQPQPQAMMMVNNTNETAIAESRIQSRVLSSILVLLHILFSAGAAVALGVGARNPMPAVMMSTIALVLVITGTLSVINRRSSMVAITHFVLVALALGCILCFLVLGGFFLFILLLDHHKTDPMLILFFISLVGGTSTLTVWTIHTGALISAIRTVERSGLPTTMVMQQMPPQQQQQFMTVAGIQ